MTIFQFTKNPYSDLENKLGYKFRKREYLIRALSHPSYCFEKENTRNNNQRLEYLGDAALGLVAAHYLFEKYPDLQEGSLTNLRSCYASGEALACIGQKIGLGNYLLLGKGERMSGGICRCSNILDAMEAILGAAYLDGGLKAVQRIFEKNILPTIKVNPHNAWENNPKGELQAWAQKHRKTNPVYRELERAGPDHALRFRVSVTVHPYASAIGEGSNKKEAEREAALCFLEEMHCASEEE